MPNLAFTSDRPTPRINTYEAFHHARSNLRSQFALILIAERMEESLALLESVLDVPVHAVEFISPSFHSMRGPGLTKS
jgi:hypothetical protein